MKSNDSEKILKNITKHKKIFLIVYMYLFFVIFSITGTLNHKCGTEYLKAKRELIIPIGDQTQERYLKANDYEGIRIHLDYSFIENNMASFDRGDLNDLRDKIMPKTKEVFEKLLKVQRIESKLRFDTNKCDEFKLPERYTDEGEGVDADLVIFVMLEDSGFFKENGIEAAAVHCLQHGITRRPVAGYIQFRPGLSVNDSTALDYQVWLAVHEISHVLVMNDSLYPDFVDHNYDTLGMDMVIGKKSIRLGKNENGNLRVENTENKENEVKDKNKNERKEDSTVFSKNKLKDENLFKRISDDSILDQKHRINDSIFVPKNPSEKFFDDLILIEKKSTIKNLKKIQNSSNSTEKIKNVLTNKISKNLHKKRLVDFKEYDNFHLRVNELKLNKQEYTIEKEKGEQDKVVTDKISTTKSDRKEEEKEKEKEIKSDSGKHTQTDKKDNLKPLDSSSNSSSNNSNNNDEKNNNKQTDNDSNEIKKNTNSNRRDFYIDGMTYDLLEDEAEVYPSEFSVTKNKFHIPLRRGKKQRAQEMSYLKSPKILEVARKHFGCDSLYGVPLEYNGGPGTVGAHWSKRYMNTDYMIGDSYGENLISEITLAMFEDSGWYKTDYYNANLFLWGKNRGCSFFNNDCVNPGTTARKSENVKENKENDPKYKKNSLMSRTNIVTDFKTEFCTDVSGPVCSRHNIFRGVCAVKKYNYDLPLAERHFPDAKIGGIDRLTDKCPIAIEAKRGQVYYGGSCRVGKKNYKYEKVCPECACFISSLEETPARNENKNTPEEKEKNFSKFLQTNSNSELIVIESNNKIKNRERKENKEDKENKEGKENKENKENKEGKENKGAENPDERKETSNSLNTVTKITLTTRDEDDDEDELLVGFNKKDLYSKDGKVAACFEFRCMGKDLMVLVDEKEYKCDSNNKVTNVKGYRGEIGCPDKEMMCDMRYRCKYGCTEKYSNANGFFSYRKDKK